MEEKVFFEKEYDMLKIDKLSTGYQKEPMIGYIEDDKKIIYQIVNNPYYGQDLSYKSKYAKNVHHKYQMVLKRENNQSMPHMMNKDLVIGYTNDLNKAKSYFLENFYYGNSELKRDFLKAKDKLKISINNEKFKEIQRILEKHKTSLALECFNGTRNKLNPNDLEYMNIEMLNYSYLNIQYGKKGTVSSLVRISNDNKEEDGYIKLEKIIGKKSTKDIKEIINNYKKLESNLIAEDYYKKNPYTKIKKIKLNDNDYIYEPKEFNTTKELNVYIAKKYSNIDILGTENIRYTIELENKDNDTFSLCLDSLLNKNDGFNPNKENIIDYIERKGYNINTPRINTMKKEVYVDLTDEKKKLTKELDKEDNLTNNNFSKF